MFKRISLHPRHLCFCILRRTPGLFLALGAWAGLMACSSPAPVPPQMPHPEPQIGDVQVAQALPTKTPREWVPELRPIFAHSAGAHFPHQTIVTEPGENAVLYLMRAARYREAADYASRAPQTVPMRFVTQKARVMADLCAPQEPCAPPLDALRSELPAVMTPVYDYWLAMARIADGDTAGALRDIRRHFDIHRRPNDARALAIRLTQSTAFGQCLQEEAMSCATILDDTDALIDQLLKASPKPNAFQAATLIHAQLDIARARHRDKRARAKIDLLVQRYPATQMALWPELQAHARALSPSQKLARIQKLISRFDYDDARAELLRLIDATDASTKIQNQAEWLYARVSMTEDPKRSEEIYKKVAARPGPNREEALFSLARVCARQLDYPGAIRRLKEYDARYPRGKYARRSLYLRGWYLFDLRRNEEARPLLLEYAQLTGDTAVWGFYAQSFLRDARYTEAIEAFEHIKAGSNPIVRGKALYWQAWAHHQLGEDDRARALFDQLHAQFPLTWYDILARERERDWFGIDLQRALLDAWNITGDPPPRTVLHPFGFAPLAPDLPKTQTLDNILTLTRFDAIDDARDLYLAQEPRILASFPAKSRDEVRLYLTHLVESYNRAWEDVAGSIRAFSSTEMQRANPRHRMAYPQPFAPLVESLAFKYDIPRFFIDGIMLQESRFRPWQVSSADAIGALQMIPKTARPIAAQLGLTYHPDTFFDPKVGFEYSIYYMAMHRARWGGNLAFTAGSYNGGPHRIGPWALRDKGKSLDVVVDEFSFDESRHYTRKVAEHTLRFAYLYAKSEREWIDTLNALFPDPVPDIEPTDDWGL